MKLFIFLIISSNICALSILPELKERISKARLQAHISEIESKCLGKQDCVRQIPLKDFFENPSIAGFKISPDGSRISFVAPWNKRMNVFVIERKNIGNQLVKKVSPAFKKQLTFVKDRDISGYFWKGNDHIVYLRDFGGDENFHLFSVNIHDGEEVDLTPFKGVKAQIVDSLEDDEDSMIIGLNKRDKRLFDAYKVNVNSGALSLIATNPGGVMGWKTDHDGQLRIAIRTDGVNSSLLYRDKVNEPFKTILTTNFREGVRPLFFTFDNKKLYVSSNLGRDKAVIATFNPHTAKEEEVLFAHPAVDVGSLSFSRKTKSLILASYVRAKRGRKFFDPLWKNRYAFIQRQFPDLETAIKGWDKEEQIFLVRTYSDRSRGSTYLFEESSQKLTLLEDYSVKINLAEMAPQIPIEYSSRDGLKIPGYLTLPLKSKLKNLPVIVNPHGGPWARDNWGFNPQVQFLANRGYAVLQMNFRGSTGYGRKFWEASFKKWGQEMQNDITDGVNWLIKSGIADPDLIAIYGASYGGYAVLAGLTFTPDLYACGIDYVGVSNIFTLLETLPPYWKPMLDMMHTMIGHPEHDKELLIAASPVFHVDKIKAPLLVAQGAKDPRVKQAESDQIVAALRKRGIDVPYLLKENEGHGFRNEENRFEFYKMAEDFLRKYLNE